MFKKLILIAPFILTACSAPDAVLKQTQFIDDQVIATDSRLRIINNSAIADSSIPGETDPRQIICAEPSPDVATTIANSFGGGINVFGYGNASISSGHVEGLVQLSERTATIQLLRDKMYQTCLAYANGAISGTTYSFIMSRLDETIVTLLMGETAGGAFGRSLASIGGKAKSSASAEFSALPSEVANLEERIAAATAAEEELRTAEKNLAEHKATKPAEGKEDEHAQRTKELEREAEASEAKSDATHRLMQDTLATASKSAAEISSIKGGGGLTVAPDPLIATTLADMQAEFMLNDVSSAIVTACVVEMGRQMGTDNQESVLKLKLNTWIGRSIDYLNENQKENKKENFTRNEDSPVALKRLLGSRLADFCYENLEGIILTSAERHNAFRTEKAKLRAGVDIAKYGAVYEEAKARAIKAIATGLEVCAQLKTDDEKAACRKKVLD